MLTLMIYQVYLDDMIRSILDNFSGKVGNVMRNVIGDFICKYVFYSKQILFMMYKEILKTQFDL